MVLAIFQKLKGEFDHFFFAVFRGPRECRAAWVNMEAARRPVLQALRKNVGHLKHNRFQ